MLGASIVVRRDRLVGARYQALHQGRVHEHVTTPNAMQKPAIGGSVQKGDVTIFEMIPAQEKAQDGMFDAREPAVPEP